jgi:hypothetical protein
MIQIAQAVTKAKKQRLLAVPPEPAFFAGIREIRLSTACAAPGSWLVRKLATTLTRSLTTSAFHARTLSHYMRFKDQMKVGADGRKRLRLVTDKD